MSKYWNLGEKMEDQDKGCVCLGLKYAWQEYPCIVAYSENYVLIDDNEMLGRIVDKYENIIGIGSPEDLAIKYNKTKDEKIALWFIDRNSETHKFWKEKYPELLVK